MKRHGFVARCSVAAVGSVMLAGVATAALADEYGNEDVEVSVEIADIVEPGVLAMTVGAGSVVLTEEGSTGTVRQFTGTLPTVTVTDTRSAEEVPDGAFWYVVGSSSAFVGDSGQPEIGAGHLGWTPRLINGGESGLVAEGDEVETVMDDGPGNNVGLVDQEFLASAADSGTVNPEGQWTATADLFLRTPATVAPGSYSATLTLSLFE